MISKKEIGSDVHNAIRSVNCNVIYRVIFNATDSAVDSAVRSAVSRKVNNDVLNIRVSDSSETVVDRAIWNMKK